MTQRMTQDPDPAQAGSKTKICYDTSGCVFPIELTATLRPSNTVVTHTITSDANHCFDVSLPAGTTGGAVEDGSGQSAAFGISVT